MLNTSQVKSNAPVSEPKISTTEPNSTINILLSAIESSKKLSPGARDKIVPSELVLFGFFVLGLLLLL